MLSLFFSTALRVSWSMSDAVISDCKSSRDMFICDGCDGFIRKRCFDERGECSREEEGLEDCDD